MKENFEFKIGARKCYVSDPANHQYKTISIYKAVDWEGGWHRLFGHHLCISHSVTEFEDGSIFSLYSFRYIATFFNHEEVDQFYEMDRKEYEELSELYLRCKAVKDNEYLLWKRFSALFDYIAERVDTRIDVTPDI